MLSNKQDLKSIPAGELLRQLDLPVKDQHIEGPDGKKRLFHLLPVSALSGVGAKDAVDWLLEILPDSVRTLNLQHGKSVLMKCSKRKRNNTHPVGKKRTTNYDTSASRYTASCRHSDSRVGKEQYKGSKQGKECGSGAFWGYPSLKKLPFG